MFMHNYFLLVSTSFVWFWAPQYVVGRQGYRSEVPQIKMVQNIAALSSTLFQKKCIH